MTGDDVAAIILAAGRGSRFGAASKLTTLLRGEPIIRHVARAALAAGAAPVVVVTGHVTNEIDDALRGLSVRFAHNRDYAQGLSTSLRAGLAALPLSARGALILLGDMPFVKAETLRLLVEAHRSARADCPAIIPLHNGRRGNPGLLRGPIFARTEQLAGDAGARRLLDAAPGVVALETDDPGVVMDIDAPEDLRRYAGD